MLIVVTVIIQIGSILSGLIEVKMYPAFQKYVRDLMINHIVEQSKTDFEELKTGEITMHLHKFPAMLYSYIEDMRDMIIPQFLVYIIAITYFSYYDKYIGIALFCIIGLLLLSVKYTLGKCNNISQERDKKYNTMIEEINDVMKNMISVLNANNQVSETKRNDEIQENYYKLSRESLKCAYTTRYYLIPVVLGFFAWSLNRLYGFVQNNKLPSHVMISLVLTLLYIMKSMWIVINNIKDQVFRWGSINESIKIFNECAPPEPISLPITDKDVNKELNGFVLKNINYGYEGRKAIFENLNLHIEPNKKTLIIGQIGSGKSTLIKILLKYQMPESGMIYYNGVPYSDIDADEIRRLIGYVPQTPSLFNRSIYENITYATPWVSEEQVIELMTKVGLADMLAKFPEGLQTNVGNNGSKLSGGQRQIVWILRVMLQNPEVIILDEPTSALDENTKPIVQRILSQVMQNKTTIMITHDQFLYNLADTIIELKDGKFGITKKNNAKKSLA
jgi:ABC-type multidrug transport system fused ATPase/permease subunit